MGNRRTPGAPPRGPHRRSRRQRPGRRCKAGPGEPASEPLPPPRQPLRTVPTGHPRRGPPPRAEAFEVTEDDGCPITLRQPPNSSWRTASRWCRSGSPLGARRRPLGVAALVEPSPRRRGPGIHGDPRRHPVEPVPHRAASRSEPALRTRTRNVAWNASSASCASPSGAGRRARPSARAAPPARRRPARPPPPAGREPLEELTVAEPGERPHAVEGIDASRDESQSSFLHHPVLRPPDLHHNWDGKAPPILRRDSVPSQNSLDGVGRLAED